LQSAPGGCASLQQMAYRGEAASRNEREKRIVRQFRAKERCGSTTKGPGNPSTVSAVKEQNDDNRTSSKKRIGCQRKQRKEKK